MAAVAVLAGGLFGWAPPAAAAAPGPFATILFSRTEITAADGCVADDDNVARLDTTVAPYLASLGLRATGTLQSGTILQSAETCTHSSSSLMSSWDENGDLASTYGWSFVSHTAHYTSNFDALTPQQVDAETCGSANTIAAHGLPGAHGLIAYPGAGPTQTEVQTDFGSKCFAWGRSYGNNGITNSAAASTPPYWQHIAGAEGGPCNDSTQACYSIPTIANTHRYVLPSRLIAAVQGLSGNNWLTLQQFMLVTGKSPSYSKSPIAWDCTSPDPLEHWTNDNERYCYSDWQKVIQALAARTDVTVTDPLSVGIAWGRPATYPTSALPPAPSSDYVLNPSFENRTTSGWTRYNPTSALAVVAVAGGSKDGSYAARITNTSSRAAITGLADKAPHWVSSTVAGKMYTGSAWLSGPGGTTITLRLRECSADGSSCPGASNASVQLPASGWVKVTVSYTARTSGRQLRFAAFGTLPATRSFLADQLSLTSN